MEEPIKEKATDTVSGSGVKSKLRYPLRSTLKSKEMKSPAPELPNSSASKRVRTPSAVSQSVGVLDFSAKNKSAKPPRRLSIPTKSTVSSAVKSGGTVTPISEARTKGSASGRGCVKTDTPYPNVSRSTSQKKLADLSSASYWLAQIKLSESAGKHVISLGFFKLAFEADCQPLQQMREELKSYASRHNLGELAEALKGLFEIYQISEYLEVGPVSESCSQVPGSETRSSDEEVHNVFPSASEDRKIRQKSESDIRSPKKEVQNVSASAKGNRKIIPKPSNSHITRAPSVRLAAKETASKTNSIPVTRRSLNKSSANSRTCPESAEVKTQKKAEKISKPEVNQAKQKIKKQGKEPPASQEDKCSVSPHAALSTAEEDKENMDAPPVEQASSVEV